ISRDLETICLKCLSKDAKKRYGTAAELAEELHAFLTERPIRARPVGTTERLWKWARRNPAWSASISVLLFLFVSAAVAGVMIREQVLENERKIHARGLVQRLLNADTADVPTIVKDMEPYRHWVNPLLNDAAKDAVGNTDDRQQLLTSLALLP